MRAQLIVPVLLIRKESEKRKTERRNGDNKRSKSYLFTFFRLGYLSSRLLSETDCIVCHKERFNGFICIVFILGAALCDLYKCQIMPQKCILKTRSRQERKRHRETRTTSMRILCQSLQPLKSASGLALIMRGLHYQCQFPCSPPLLTSCAQS